MVELIQEDRLHLLRDYKLLPYKTVVYRGRDLFDKITSPLLLARSSHQFRRRQVQSFWQLIIIVYIHCQNTEENDAG